MDPSFQRRCELTIFTGSRSPVPGTSNQGAHARSESPVELASLGGTSQPDSPRRSRSRSSSSSRRTRSHSWAGSRSRSSSKSPVRYVQRTPTPPNEDQNGGPSSNTSSEDESEDEVSEAIQRGLAVTFGANCSAQEKLQQKVAAARPNKKSIEVDNVR